MAKRELSRSAFMYFFILYSILCINGALLEPGNYEHHLLTVHNSSSGIDVCITTLTGELCSETFSSLYLPPECGENFLRCKDLLVDSNELDENVTQFLSIIPATRAVVILDIHYNGSALLLYNFSRVDQTIRDCNPTAVFKVAQSYYTMCIKQMSYLTALELHLDPHSIQDAYFSQTIDTIRFENDHKISNFLSIYLGSIFGFVGQSHQILFIIQNCFYSYEPIHIRTHRGPSIQCQPNRIEYAEGVVLAYCDDRSLFINLTNWHIKTTFYNDSGYPYLCPNYPHVQLSAIHNGSNDVTFLKYQAIQSRQPIEKEIPILGSGGTLDANQCFGNRTTYFAYSTSDSVHIVDVMAQIDYNISSHRCSGPWCLSVIGGQYLIVQEQTQGGTTISVLDAQQNLAPVVITQGQQADLAALIRTTKPTEPAPTPSSTMTFVPSSSTPQVTPTATPIQTAVVAIAVPICVVTVILLMVVVLVGLIWFRHNRKRWPWQLCSPQDQVVQEGERFDFQTLIAPDSACDVAVNPEQSTEDAEHNNCSNLVV